MLYGCLAFRVQSLNTLKGVTKRVIQGFEFRDHGLGFRV